MNLFDRCMVVIFQHEGGFQNFPDDSGNWVGGYKTGKLVGTKYGIAAKFFPGEDIVNLTKERAKEIYFESFWEPMNLIWICNDNIVLELFDMGVNARPRRVIKIAQRLTGAYPDGVLGDLTTKAINNHDGFLKDFKHARRVYYEHVATIRDNYKFLRTWLNRVDSTHF